MRRLAVLLVALVGCLPVPPPRGAVGGRAPSTSPAASGPRLTVSDLEAAIHDATNAARRRQRRPTLAAASDLAAVARRHSGDMARRGFFGHVNPDGLDPTTRATQAGVTCRVEVGNRTYVDVNENLAQDRRYSGWQDRRSSTGTVRTYRWLTAGQLADRTVQGWLNSPGHRRNLLNPTVTREGIGVFLADDGQVYITQVLC